jgi:iron(III) transport system substrate-binding protein
MVTRRTLIALPALLFAAGALAAPPEPAKVTQALIDAAKKEGKVVWYTSVDLPVAEKIGKNFEAKYPGVRVQVERTGAERVFQRMAQEYGSKIHAVDVVNSSDAAHFIIWKRDGWLASYLPEDVVAHYAKEHYDPDGMFAAWRATLSPIAYNTKLVKPDDAPKSFADLLDPKWSGKIVKAHPGYSGIILTATFQISRDLGWEYFEKLAKQRVMQTQSATEPPKKLTLGERPIMADGSEYIALMMKEAGNPIEIVYPTEGTPLIIGPTGVMKNAPNPNAARLFQSYLFMQESQQFLIDVGNLRSFHTKTTEKPGRKKLSEIKLMKEDPEAVERQVDEIKEKYAKYFVR